jgi:hypothetical protein
MAHEVLVDLFKNRPELGPELLTEALGVTLPSYSEARLVSIDLTQIRPAEYRADVVVLLLDAGAARSVVIVEVQLAVDDDKRFTWPEYTMGARAKYRCPAGLLVVAPQPEIAAWCAQPIDTGIPGPSWPCSRPWRTVRASRGRRSRRRCCPWSGSSTMNGPGSTAIWC